MNNHFNNNKTILDSVLENIKNNKILQILLENNAPHTHFGICYTHFCFAKMNIHTQNVSRRNIYSFAVNNTLEHRWPEFIVENKKGINLHDIIISVYKLKRSKFSLNEYMYEINEFYLLNYATEHEITMVITFICGL
ncbi:hypothetical protein H012_gp831 [Acanthamoeba polyphaga moumouvirus]|uniref:Uncharacterized protein n=1 Tax=Acanthamoeba polyphaga moumouvirus TaxID=1269028 RepID=L7RB43_9VIRU|nr:hypothetical protein H012_gp831 [Acanthamoeba polyphaga moumouvirus]AGC01634.1 hypothetical protein Moumou_00088 [Acanthamoeba polyphaga moumouvirus]